MESCRVSYCSVSTTHRVNLFSAAERLRNIITVPVDTSMSDYMYRSCNGKFLMAEAFVALAKITYTETRVPSDLELSNVQMTRKRSKETSGNEASPYTLLARPVAKRRIAGRRPDFSCKQ